MYVFLRIQIVIMKFSHSKYKTVLQMKMNALQEWLLADCMQRVKTPKGITTAFAPTGSRVRIPVRKTARTLMNVRTKRTKHALGTPSVKTPLGALPVCVRKDLNAIAIRDALTLMNVKFLLTRYFLTCHITDIHSN